MIAHRSGYSGLAVHVPFERAVRLFVACVLCMATSAWSQVDLLNPSAQSGAARAGGNGEIGLIVTSLGLGNHARPGDWAGIRIRVTERGDTQREIIVQASIRDADGDTAQYQTVLTTNPGIDQPVWVYARLPYDILQRGSIRVQAFEAVEDPAATPENDRIGFVTGRLLGQIDTPLNSNSRVSDGVMAVVGTKPGGIMGYTQGAAGGTDGNPLGHEVTQVLQLNPDDLPDRWMGLASITEVVWNGPAPSELRIEQVRALREWVQRGGHLVIILPSIGQDWLAISNQELAAMLPRAAVERARDTSLASLRPLLTDDTASVRPIPDSSVTLNILSPLADAGPEQADPILNDAQGRCVVMPRSIGTGQGTLVGLPLTHPCLLRAGLPETDVFWHRLLGRRGHVANTTEMKKLMEENAYFNPKSRDDVQFDVDIPGMIAKSGRSLAGVTLGLIVFVIYWIVAGPGGFALLRARNRQKYAWFVFFCVSLGFTVLAWSGATLLRPKHVEISHLSILDHVYGQRVQRLPTWASVLLPVYGQGTIGLDSDDTPRSQGGFVQAVAPWESFREAGQRSSFPDARPYPINSRSPEAMTCPARATVKQVQMDWAGGMAWDSIRPVTTKGQDPMSAITLAQGAASQSALAGSIVHHLPGALEEVQIVVFRGQIPVQAGLGKGALIARANAYQLQLSKWEPGVPLDLGQATAGKSLNANADAKLRSLISRASRTPEGMPNPANATERLIWLAFFNLFAPPEYTGQGYEGPVRAMRYATHAIDISRWATRHCEVVIGLLHTPGEDSLAAPVWVKTNGTRRKVQASGTTVVRWIYPLAPNPPMVRLPKAEDETTGERVKSAG